MVLSRCYVSLSKPLLSELVDPYLQISGRTPVMSNNKRNRRSSFQVGGNTSAQTALPTPTTACFIHHLVRPWLRGIGVYEQNLKHAYT